MNTLMKLHGAVMKHIIGMQQFVDMNLRIKRNIFQGNGLSTRHQQKKLVEVNTENVQFVEEYWKLRR